MKNHLVIYISLLAVLALAVTGPVMGESVISYDSANLLSDHLALAEVQETAMTENKAVKYVHVPEFEVDGIIYSVTEYVTPKGEAGFQTIIKYDNKISSVGYGPESEARTYEETYTIFDNSVSTSTDPVLRQ